MMLLLPQLAYLELATQLISTAVVVVNPLALLVLLPSLQFPTLLSALALLPDSNTLLGTTVVALSSSEVRSVLLQPLLLNDGLRTLTLLNSMPTWPTLPLPPLTVEMVLALLGTPRLTRPSESLAQLHAPVLPALTFTALLLTLKPLALTTLSGMASPWSAQTTSNGLDHGLFRPLKKLNS
jgi:hypothetical protein